MKHSLSSTTVGLIMQKGLVAELKINKQFLYL